MVATVDFGLNTPSGMTKLCEIWAVSVKVTNLVSNDFCMVRQNSQKVLSCQAELPDPCEISRGLFSHSHQLRTDKGTLVGKVSLPIPGF